MKKNYVKPGIALVLMQIGPNAGTSGGGGMQPIGAKEGSFDESYEDNETNAGWTE